MILYMLAGIGAVVVALFIGLAVYDVALDVKYFFSDLFDAIKESKEGNK